MKYVLPLLAMSAFMFADSEEPKVEEVALTTPPTFTTPSLQAPPQMTNPIPILPKAYKNPYTAVGLSILVPGLGHLYLEDYATAAGLFASTALLSPINSSSTQNFWFYNIFAVYRDVRINNNQKGYSYKMPSDNFSDLATAPFRWSIMKQPEVWGGIVVSLALAAGAVSLSNLAKVNLLEKTKVNLSPIRAFPIGIGEESMFRGFLQSYFCERMSTSSAIILSSIIFGAVHMPKAFFYDRHDRWRFYTFSLPLITGVGGYMGWLTDKTKSLQSSVALHAWYDFTLMLIDTLAMPTAIAGGKEGRFAYSFNF